MPLEPPPYDPAIDELKRLDERERKPPLYAAAWECIKISDCVKTLLTMTGYEDSPPGAKVPKAAWEHFAERIAEEVEYSRLQGSVSETFPAFDTATVKRWVVQNEFREEDRKFLPFVERALMNTKSIKVAPEPSADNFYGKDLEAMAKLSIVPDEAVHPGLPYDTEDKAEMYHSFSTEKYRDDFSLHIEVVKRQHRREESASCKKGYFADYLKLAMDNLNLNKEELCMRTGIYPSFMQAFIDGTLVPEGEARSRLMREMGALKNDAHKMIIKDLLDKDEVRMRKECKGASKRLPVVKALGAVTRDTHVHEFIDAAFAKGRWEKGLKYKNVRGTKKNSVPLVRALRTQSAVAASEGRHRDFEFRSESRENIMEFAQGIAKAAKDTTGLYETLITEFCFRDHQKQPFIEVFESYLKAGGKDLDGLVEYAAKKWECRLKEAYETIGLASGGDRRGTLLMADIADKNGFSFEQKQKLMALRTGAIDMPSVEQLVAQAQDILNDDKPPFYKHSNALSVRIRKMPLQKDAKPTDEINKSQVPAALLSLLLERTGTSITNYLRAIGKGVNNQVPSEITTGETGFLVMRSEDRTYHQPENAKPAAAYFTNNPELEEKLALAFLEIGKKSTPDELFAKVHSGSMKIGEMVQTLRLQRFARRGQMATSVRGHDAGEATFIRKMETDNAPVSPETATPMADYLYSPYPDSKTKADFILAAQGKAHSEAHDKEIVQKMQKIEAAIEKGYKEYGKPDAPTFATILPDIKDLIADGGMVKTFLKAVSCTNEAYNNWLRGDKVGKPELAESITSELGKYGMKEEFKPKLMQLALQVIPFYDASVLASISKQSSAEERTAALTKMRENQCLFRKDMGDLMKTSRETYPEIEETGWFQGKDDVRGRKRRETQVVRLAAALIPDGVPDCLEERMKLVQILVSPPPEIMPSGPTALAGHAAAFTKGR